MSALFKHIKSTLSNEEFNILRYWTLKSHKIVPYFWRIKSSLRIVYDGETQSTGMNSKIMIKCHSIWNQYQKDEIDEFFLRLLQPQCALLTTKYFNKIGEIIHFENDLIRSELIEYLTSIFSNKDLLFEGPEYLKEALIKIRNFINELNESEINHIKEEIKVKSFWYFPCKYLLNVDNK